MLEDYIQKILREQELTRRLTDPYGLSDARSRGLLPSVEPPYSALMMQSRADDARRIWMDQNERQIERAAEARQLADSFRYVQIDEINRLAKQALVTDSLHSKLLQSIDLQTRMATMHHPWLGHDVSKSALAFTEMQAIGVGLNTRPPFETELASAIRGSLGDWRETFEPPLATLLDATLRSGLYVERGFNAALTDFSEAAFSESAGLAGLDTLPEARADEGEELSDAEIGFRRNAAAFDRLQRFETEMRQFIERTMVRVFGDKWMKQQIPKVMLDNWQDKREAALNAGEPERPLIDYADFTDYKSIVERGDNWREAFKVIFERPEDVRESLQRLQPVRVATMHARFITRDDEMMLIVETKRLQKAMKKSL